LSTIFKIREEVSLSEAPSLLFSHSYLSTSSVSGKMFPISRVVHSTEVSSASDPSLSSDSILIKWRPVSAVSGIGSWEPSSHTILKIPAGGVLVSWLVSLLSDEIKGFIVKGEFLSSLFLHHHRFLLSSCFRSYLLLLFHSLHRIFPQLIILASVHLRPCHLSLHLS
jgi:hypothetical protein